MSIIVITPPPKKPGAVSLSELESKESDPVVNTFNTTEDAIAYLQSLG